MGRAQVMVFGTIDYTDVPFVYSLTRFLTILIGTIMGVLGSLVILPEFVTPSLFARYDGLFTFG
jgi:uncharacterized membrane protein YgaE (UPF0421/DUF939 family)